MLSVKLLEKLWKGKREEEEGRDSSDSAIVSEHEKKKDMKEGQEQTCLKWDRSF